MLSTTAHPILLAIFRQLELSSLPFEMLLRLVASVHMLSTPKTIGDNMRSSLLRKDRQQQLYHFDAWTTEIRQQAMDFHPSNARIVCGLPKHRSRSSSAQSDDALIGLWSGDLCFPVPALPLQRLWQYNHEAPVSLELKATAEAIGYSYVVSGARYATTTINSNIRMQREKNQSSSLCCGLCLGNIRAKHKMCEDAAALDS